MKPFLSIERARNIILASGLLIFLVLVGFLLFGHWKRRALLQDLPRRLGADIQLAANQFDYTQTRRGKTLFHIHAEKAEQTRQSGETELHHVQIEFFNPSGAPEDTIRGDEFSYNQTQGRAVAKGVVEILVRRPSQANSKEQAQNSQIQIRTSGLIFDQKSEIATTSQHLDFQLPQGSGTAIGATYDAIHGKLILNSDVHIQIQQQGQPISVQADHAEMDKAALSAVLSQMQMHYPAGSAEADHANLQFRTDGSVLSLHAADRVHLHSLQGADARSEIADFQFNTRSQPTLGVLSGGTHFQLVQDNRKVTGSSTQADLHFDNSGVLRSVQLMDGARMEEEQNSVPAHGQAMQLFRSWRSQTAKLEFASLPTANASAKTSRQLQLREMDGDGSVAINSSTMITGQLPQSSRMHADHVKAMFTADGDLSELLGTGHSGFEQQTGNAKFWKNRWSSQSDTLDVQMLIMHSKHGVVSSRDRIRRDSASDQIQSILQTGNVILHAEQQDPKSSAAIQSVQATATRSVYDGTSGLLHLLGSSQQRPQIQGSGFRITASKIDLNRTSQDVSAEDAVSATWAADDSAPERSNGSRSAVHVQAQHADWKNSSQEMTFLGDAQHSAHLWQDASSVTAPRIRLNRMRQTLDADTSQAQNPVVTVLAESPRSSRAGATGAEQGRGMVARILRLTSGRLHESYAQSLANFTAEPLRQVAVTIPTMDGLAWVQSNHVFVQMHPGQSSAAGAQSTPLTAVDRMECRGDVQLQMPGRTGKGASLVYTSGDATAVLRGGDGRSPSLTDDQRGTISGREIQLRLTDDRVRILDASGVTHTRTYEHR